MQRYAWIGLLAAISFACKKDECPPLIVVSDTACETSQDCIDEGFSTLTCVSGICRRPCLRDRDCILPELDQDDPCINEIAPQKPAVCENQLCVDGCTDSSECSNGQSCQGGRCAYFAEGFEDEDKDGAVSLDQLMWNTVTKELQNLRTAIAWQGLRGCSLGDERCAGIAAEGERFVAIEAVPTPEKGTPDVTLTCRPCACCLECMVEEPDFPARIPDCPGNTVPIALTCEAPNPAKCADVCAACDQCPNASVQLGERLLSCEQDVAQKTCSTCPSCNAVTCETCRTDSCPACSDIDSAACKTCEMNSCPGCVPCRECNLCSRAIDCALSDPNSQTCIANTAACDAQGNDGCFPTPINYPRAQLTDLEQSLVSPPIDLSGAAGPVSLLFEYVPFNVGEKYRPGIQGVPASMWPDPIDQEVVVQLCSGSCESEASWVDAVQVNGAKASFPPLTQRGNGLSLGRQSTIDWGSGLLEVDIPEGMRSGQFRFRFLPRLDDNVIVGVDNILIRSRQ